MKWVKEKDNIRFYDVSQLTETEGICRRAQAAYIEEQLSARFPGEGLVVKSVEINRRGQYKKFPHAIKQLPPYCAVTLEHCTGKHTERIIVWSPLAWNDRFIGTAGGGTGTGGKQYIKRPDNTSRGLTLPMAVCNGFTSATTDAGNGKQQWALDKKSCELDWERIENWRARSTHFMTLAGKAVAEVLHQRGVSYSYLHGGSGGGRQSMVEAQEFPQDYNGIWASCPAIHWDKFVLCGLWPIAVMNSYRHILSPQKIKYFMTAAQNSVGGAEAYYKYDEEVVFDPFSVVGQQTKGGLITENDAKIMQAIWQGPRDEADNQLWCMFRPGVLFWNVGIPVGAFYYSLLRRRPKPFIISTHYARWVTKNPKQKFERITIEEFVKLFRQSITEFAMLAADKADLSAFAQAGGKLMIDHGIDDPLVPVDGTIDYYENLCAAMGGKEQADRFCRLYITPGDGHGSCKWHGPGITERDGMAALMDWVERGIPPKALRVVQADKSGGIIREGTQLPYSDNHGGKEQ